MDPTDPNPQHRFICLKTTSLWLSACSSFYLGPGVVSEEHGWAALELLLCSQVGETVRPVRVEGHAGRIAGCQAGPGHRHTGPHHLKENNRYQISNAKKNGLWWQGVAIKRRCTQRKRYRTCMLLNVAAHNVSIQNIKMSKRERHITYSVTKHTYVL